ncbi:hypothetical protein WN943_013363 [Citrus x changshan-huyou]
MTRGLSLDPLHHGQRWRISSSVVTPSKPSVPHGFTRSVARCLGPSRSPSKAQSPQSSSRSSSVVTPSKPSVLHAYAHGFTPLVFGPHCSNRHSSLSPCHHSSSLLQPGTGSLKLYWQSDKRAYLALHQLNKA